MKILEWAKEEFKRAPVATASAALSALVLIIGVIAAWLWGQPIQPSLAPDSAASIFSRPRGQLLSLFMIGAILVSSLTFGNFARILYSFNKGLAVFISIVFASISILLSRILAQYLGYLHQDSAAVIALDRLIYFGTVLVFLAIAGGRPIRDFVRPDNLLPADRELSEETVGGLLAAVAMLIGLWSGLVAWAHTQLIAAFFP